MKAIARAEEINIGFQIAPMIDVVFVIMLFFMVMAGAIKTERQINTVMPGHMPELLRGEPPDEISIAIDEDGVIAMNEEIAADQKDVKMSRLVSVLSQLRRDSIAREAKLPITIQADPATRYQRTIDVLNVLSKVGLKDVTFTVGDDDADIRP